MSSKTAVRTDGEFGGYYADTADIRAVIAAYRADTGCSYRQAWQAWMGWSGVKMTYQDASQNNHKIHESGWFHYAGYDLNESARQEYSGNGCIFAAGLVSDESANPACDTMYLVVEKEGQEATMMMLRPDEMAAIARIAASVLWSDLAGRGV